MRLSSDFSMPIISRRAADDCHASALMPPSAGAPDAAPRKDVDDGCRHSTLPMPCA